MSETPVRDVYVAIARAKRRGRGIHLSAYEVFRLVAQDDAIISAAESCETECVCDIMRNGVQCTWCVELAEGGR